MANTEHVFVVLSGAAGIARWRDEHRGERLDLRGALLRRANLVRLDLNDALLDDANLEWADLRWADLSRANLSSVRLVRADLHKADLSRADLRGADLRIANLEDANLQDADINGARMERTRLLNTDFTGTRGLNAIEHTGPSEIDEETIRNGGQVIADALRRLFGHVYGADSESADLISKLSSPGKSGIRVFVSHSSKDLQIVEPLVDLLRTSLSLSPREIRCTSLDGHRLPAGVDFVEAVRQEVFDAQVFIGLLSAQSLQSSFVMFEMGARWVTGKYLIPLLASTVTSDSLPLPIRNRNALNCTEAELHQLVSNLAAELSIEPTQPEVCQRLIERLIAAAS